MYETFKQTNISRLVNELAELPQEAEELTTSDYQGRCLALVNKIKAMALKGEI